MKKISKIINEAVHIIDCGCDRGALLCDIPFL